MITSIHTCAWLQVYTHVRDYKYTHIQAWALVQKYAHLHAQIAFPVLAYTLFTSQGTLLQISITCDEPFLHSHLSLCFTLVSSLPSPYLCAQQKRCSWLLQLRGGSLL